MRMVWIVLVLLAGCAGKPTVEPVLNTEKEFEVPVGLADQFAVRDSAIPVAIPAPVVAPGQAKPLTKAEIKAAKKEKKMIYQLQE